ncbi:unnamed protein product [Effrenium voratum]|uniref:PNPLA domain-containing protein n=1 Tax=Effrenium voratum TaxID=2562239 RepID=A0AA36NF87_9DINO|nr:unnamed protein product [Effrenium voratum]CAJ1410465.1 unnamed protein product [Effrenium voratum]
MTGPTPAMASPNHAAAEPNSEDAEMKAKAEERTSKKETEEKHDGDSDENEEVERDEKAMKETEEKDEKDAQGGHFDFTRIRDMAAELRSIHDIAAELPSMHDVAAELSTRATELSAKAQATATELSAKAQATATELSAKAQATATELTAKAQATATELSAKGQAMATELSAKAHELSDSIFNHMFRYESAVEARRRALMLVDVLVERHSAGRLKRRWVLAATCGCFCYLRYVLPVLACWGTRRWEQTVDANEFEETVGGHNSHVSFAVLVVVSLGYLSLLHFSSRLMEARVPIQQSIFETLVVYNMTQFLFNAFVSGELLREAWAQGFRRPWGNVFTYSKEGHRLGYLIWLHYHGCQLELLDTLFVVIRKKFQKITFLHVWLRILNMWGWWFACRYACGGDTYFPAAVNSATRAVVYAFYSWSLLTERGVPLVQKAHVTELQMFQFAICACHALFCVYNFWNMQIPRAVLLIYFLCMMNGLMLYTDFHYQEEGKSEARLQQSRKVSIAFDSSGWMYCYHFGVASWLREHIIPDDMTPEAACTDAYPENLSFSGSSGGALVATVLGTGLQPSDVFEMVLRKQPACAYNPFKMLPAVEEVLSEALPANSHQTLSGRVRILLTRVSFKYPFLTAEVVNTFSSTEDVFHALRASCHVPIVGGMGPYCYDKHAYFDGMFWPQVLVPWKGTGADFVVRVAALLRNLSSDIKAPLVPAWWSIFPPQEDVLRGLYWQGYRDAARWFARNPEGTFDCLSCRASATPTGLRRRPSGKGREAKDAAEELSEENQKATAWSTLQKMLTKTPAEAPLPDVDPVTGKSPADYIAIMEEAMRRQTTFVGLLSALAVLGLFLWIIFGWL